MSEQSTNLSSDTPDAPAKKQLGRRALLAGVGGAAISTALPRGWASAAKPAKLNAGATVLPQWWGAQADGVTDDTAAINQAIQDLYDAGGGTLHLPAGTYLLATITPGEGMPGEDNDERYSTLIIPKSGVNIEGEGDATVLKAAAGLSAQQWNFIFPPQSIPENPLNDVEYRNFKLDADGENNLHDPLRWNTVGTRFGAGIVIDGLTFFNNPGRICLQFGFNHHPHPVTDVKIRNCHFDTVAGAVPGNVDQWDHSSINARVDECVIENNLFTQPALNRTNAANAIEVQCSNAVISGNEIVNYFGGMNVVASTTDQINVTYVDNVMHGIEHEAFKFWCQNDRIMENVCITGNTMECGNPLGHPINPSRSKVSPIMPINVSQPIMSLTIDNNRLEYMGDVSAPHENNRGMGVTIGKCRDLKIINNEIIGTLASAIGHIANLGKPLTGNIQEIEILDNYIEDCCRRGASGSLASRTAIVFIEDPAQDPPRRLNLLRVERNSIINTGDPTMERGFHATHRLIDGTIVDNVMVGTSIDIHWKSGPEILQLHVEHTGPGSPEGAVRASVGSVYTNAATSETWEKTSGGTTRDGWELASP